MATVAQSHFPFDEVDDASADVILQAQLDDLEEFVARAGKQRVGAINDIDVAAGLLQENIGDVCTFNCFSLCHYPSFSLHLVPASPSPDEVPVMIW